MLTLSLEENIAIRQLELFERDQERYIETLVTCVSQRKLLLKIYGFLVRHNEIEPIESLDPMRKDKLKHSAMEHAQRRLEVDDCVDLAKALWCIEKLAKKD